MDINKVIQKKALELETYVINARRTIHTFAEIAGEEVKTSAFVCEEIERLGLSYDHVADTAVVATLNTGKPGPVIVLRADMDALLVKESQKNLINERTCISENPDTCHACGHDAHTAMLLGSMNILVQMREELTGTILFCYEEGEECGKSVKQILEYMEDKKPDTVWAIHVYAGLESGKISVDAGARMAGGAGIGIRVLGKGGHGSRPDKCVNPTYAAAAIVTNIPGAFINQLDVEKTVTFGITTIKGGDTANIIPEYADINGTLRFFDLEEGKKAIDILKKVAEHTAVMQDCTVDFAEYMRVFGGPATNDEVCAELAWQALTEVLPDKTVTKCPPWYASESYAQYLRKYPGILAFLGIKNEEKGTGANHHNEFFDVDEDVLKIGVMSTVKYALAYMGK